jgi:simple sugar transport system ATP-binding protein
VTTNITAGTEGRTQVPIVELRGIGKTFGNITAVSGVDLSVRAGEVACILGDNGAGKSTLIKIICGLYSHDSGSYLIDGHPVHFHSPRDALDRGITAVYQDLAMIPLLSVWRNFFLGSEISTGRALSRRLNADKMRAIVDQELKKMGVVVADIEQPVVRLSGGQRQVVAVARAIYFGARVLILDEPTAALGVKQSGIVLKYIAAARDAGLGVIFISHNPHHAYLVGDHFVVLKLGQVELDAPRKDLPLERLTYHMAGGGELTSLEHELQHTDRPQVAPLHDIENN